MKMDACAWRAEYSEDYTYKLQIDDIKKGDKTTFNELFKDWHESAYGWNEKGGGIKILTKSFETEKDWVEWAKKCPVKIVEVKYRSGKEVRIQRSCITRKKRVQ
jgi:hypothetical protein